MKIKSDRLEEHEVNAMLSLADKRTRMGLRDYCTMRLLFESGVRKSELCALTVGSLKTYAGGFRIVVRSLKKRKEEFRELEITPELYNTLQRYINSNGAFGPSSPKANPESPLLHTLGDRGNHPKQGITPRAVDLIVRRYVAKAGIDKRITPHSFRSGLASTLLIDKHFDLATCKAILGHKSVNTTMLYTITTEKEKRKAVESLALV